MLSTTNWIVLMKCFYSWEKGRNADGVWGLVVNKLVIFDVFRIACACDWSVLFKQPMNLSNFSDVSRFRSIHKHGATQVIDSKHNHVGKLLIRTRFVWLPRGPLSEGFHCQLSLLTKN